MAGEYTLHVKNITDDDEGDYRCIDDAGFGPDMVSAYLKVTERQHNDGITTEDHSGRFNSLSSLLILVIIILTVITVFKS